jgi:prephenate dehydrogenase
LVHSSVSALGADVVAVDPARHDAIVAVVSHVPHLTAAALMGVAAGHAQDQEGLLLRLAAGGFRDMTRISAGPAGIWPDVCNDNAPAITAVLDELVSELERLRTIVAGRQRADLVAALERARDARLAMPAGGTRRTADVVEVRVPVVNRPGVMMEVTVLASELGVNLEAFETVDATEADRGMIILVVAAAAAGRFRDALVAKGYHPTVRAVG